MRRCERDQRKEGRQGNTPVDRALITWFSDPEYKVPQNQNVAINVGLAVVRLQLVSVLQQQSLLKEEQRERAMQQVLTYNQVLTMEDGEQSAIDRLADVVRDIAVGLFDANSQTSFTVTRNLTFTAQRISPDSHG